MGPEGKKGPKNIQEPQNAKHGKLWSRTLWSGPYHAFKKHRFTQGNLGGGLWPWHTCDVEGEIICQKQENRINAKSKEETAQAFEVLRSENPPGCPQIVVQ